MPQDIRNRQEPAAFQCWHPDGTPYSPADYRKAGMPVPTPEQIAHWAEMDRIFADPVRIVNQNKK